MRIFLYAENMFIFWPKASPQAVVQSLLYYVLAYSFLAEKKTYAYILLCSICIVQSSNISLITLGLGLIIKYATIKIKDFSPINIDGKFLMVQSRLISNEKNYVALKVFSTLVCNAFPFLQLKLVLNTTIHCTGPYFVDWYVLDPT